MDFRIQGVIELESRVGRGVASATSSLNELNEVVINQWWGLQNIAAAFAAIGGAVSAGVGLAISEAVRWEQAMADVERTVANVGDYDWETALSVGTIERDIRRVASVTPVAADALAKIAAEAGALGIAAADVGDFTETVAGLAAVTDLTEDAAAVMFARISSLTGLPSEEYHGLASAILEVGRSTAATEEQINTFTVRLAAFLAPIGFTADQIVGLAGTMASLGIAAERGSTAIQKTMFDMTEAFNEGGKSAEDFATIAGVSMEEFGRLLSEDPAELLTKFVEGLDNVREAGLSVEQVLANLGIREVRQVSTLTALAKASQNAVSPQTQLRNALQTSANAMSEASAFAQITSKYYATFGAQVTILRNKIDELQQMFGETLMPVMRIINIVLNAFLDGLYSLPSSLRNAYGALVLIGGAIAGLTAAVFTIVPRIVLMRHSLLTLQAASGAAVTGLVGVQNQANLTTVSLSNLGVAANAANIGLINVGASGARSQLSMAGAGGAAAGLTKWVSRAGKALGTLGVVLSVATIGTSLYGAVVGRVEDEVEELAQADLALTNILRQQTGDINQNVQAWAADRIIMAGADQMARQLGIDIATLTSIITGIGATQATWDSFAAAMDRAGDEGRQLLEIVVNLRNVFQASSAAARETAQFNDVAADSYEGLGEAAEDATEALRKEHQAIDARNQALLAYGDAVISAKQAQFALADAQKAYEEAQANAQDPSRIIKDLERDIRDARWAVEDATRKVGDAEKNLKNARANQRLDLQEAEWDLADARDRHLDGLEKIADLEENLAELRRGASADELRDATLRLQKAQVGLLRSHQSLADAEWYLNYIRAEGAGDRDVREAELLLEEARYKSAEAQDELSDSQKDLNELRRGASPKEIAKAERDLARAYRDSKRAAQDIKELERDVAQIRRDIAKDTAYKQALRDLDDANYDLVKSNRELIKAQEALQDVLDGSLFDELARAELELEAALYNLAKANTEVTKQTALMNGEFFSAGHEAQELARQLGLIGADAPASIKQNLANIAGVLRRGIPQMSSDIEDGISELGSNIGGGGGIGGALEDALIGDLDASLNTVQEETQGWLDRFLGWLEENMPGIGTTIGAIIGGAVGGPLGAAIGGAIGWALGKASTYVWPKIWGFMNSIAEHLTGMDMRGLWDNGFRFWREALDKAVVAVNRWAGDVGEALSWSNIKEWFGGIKEGLAEWWSDIQVSFRNGDFFNYSDAFNWSLRVIRGVLAGLAGGPGMVVAAMVRLWSEVVRRVKSHLGIRSPSTVFKTIGRDVVRGLVAGILNSLGSLTSAGAAVVRRIKSSIGSFYNDMKTRGSNLVSGIYNGVVNKYNGLAGRFSGIANRIGGRFGSYYNTMVKTGSNLVSGIYNGIVQKYNGIAGKFTHVKNLIKDRMGGYYDSLVSQGHNMIVGLYNGAVQRWNSLASRFRTIGDNIKNALGRAFNFGSPSKVTTQWGRWIIEGFMQGIDKEAGHLAKQMASIMELMTPDDFGSLASQFRDATRNAFPADTPVFRQMASQRGDGEGGGDTVNRGGDTINVKALTDADPFKIASEIAWQKRIRTRN